MGSVEFENLESFSNTRLSSSVLRYSRNLVCSAASFFIVLSDSASSSDIAARITVTFVDSMLSTSAFVFSIPFFHFACAVDDFPSSSVPDRSHPMLFTMDADSRYTSKHLSSPFGFKTGALIRRESSRSVPPLQRLQVQTATTCIVPSRISEFRGSNFRTNLIGALSRAVTRVPKIYVRSGKRTRTFSLRRIGPARKTGRLQEPQR